MRTPAQRTLDIHSYPLKTRQAETQLHNANISERNKVLILGYRDACLIKGVCGSVRLIRVLGTLRLFAQLLQQDFDMLDRAGVERLVSMLLQRRPAYSAETLGTYKAILKNFLTWVMQPNDFPTKTPPSLVSWITTHVKAKDKRRLHRNELLTPGDIEALLAVCHNTRDKALLSILWETGGRISELGNLQLLHITKHEHGYLLDLYGKTGHRNPLIVSSSAYLAQWLANHPFKHNPDSPLWVHYQYTKDSKHLKYDTIRTLLRRYFQRAGITKPYHPHLFRHSRATHVLANGIMSEQAAKTYFGWTPSSKMLATYAHLTTTDANDAILRENHLAPQQVKTDELRPTACPTCHTLNARNATYCTTCTNILDATTAYHQREQATSTNAMLLQLIKVLGEKGLLNNELLDATAEEVHKIGLGPALKTLATKT